MEKNQEYISALRQAVEEKLGQSVTSPTDFARLSDSLLAALGESLSVSTLKRLWGYVDGYATVRTSTLNVLSRYVGCRDWNEFCQSLADNDGSSFPEGDVVAMSTLAIGDCVEVRWAPGRRIVVKNLGQWRMTVVESERSKLPVGTTFTCAGMVNGEPLTLTQVEIPGTDRAQTYVCGKHGGITARRLPPVSGPAQGAR